MPVTIKIKDIILRIVIFSPKIKKPNIVRNIILIIDTVGDNFDTSISGIKLKIKIIAPTTKNPVKIKYKNWLIVRFNSSFLVFKGLLTKKT